LVDHLNRHLKSKLQSKKKKADKIHIRQYPWLYLAVIIIILLIVISYFVIQRLQQH